MLGVIGLCVFAAGALGQLRVHDALSAEGGSRAQPSLVVISDACAMLNGAGVTAVLLAIQPAAQFLPLARAAALSLGAVHALSLIHI